MTRMILVLLFASSAAFAQSTTNQKPWRLICLQAGVVTNRLITSGGKILNHQTYVFSRADGDTAGAFEKNYTQTNSAGAIIADRFAGFVSGISEQQLFDGVPLAWADSDGYGNAGFGSTPQDTASPKVGDCGWSSLEFGSTYDSGVHRIGEFAFYVRFQSFFFPVVPCAEISSVSVDQTTPLLMQFRDSDDNPVGAHFAVTSGSLPLPSNPDNVIAAVWCASDYRNVDFDLLDSESWQVGPDPEDPTGAWTSFDAESFDIIRNFPSVKTVNMSVIYHAIKEYY